MSLSPGVRLGPYEILSPLGAGGMGEVYRAADTKLKREVAIKVLPESLAQNPERLVRFEREAQVLASLNHPHVAAIYGVEDSTSVKALVMELVDGATLQDRLDSGSIAVEEALPIAKQIAEALEAAHEKGIVHRDLKPANVKITPDGAVKVLDFGLAKAMDPAATSSPDMTRSPTISIQATAAGIILGTAAYMSPEQARGSRVDKRADIWAFGVVVYEMLTGKRLFHGETVSDTLAAVLRAEVDLHALPAGVPPEIRRLLRRCLERNPKNRLHDIADARIVLDDLMAGRLDGTALPAVTGRLSRSGASRAALLAGAILIAVLGGVGGWLAHRPTPPAQALLSRLSIPLPAGKPYKVQSIPGRSIAISRDGTLLAYVAAFEGGEQLVVRALAEIQPRAIVSGDVLRQPFFSPDGKWIGYFGRSGLQKVSVDGGRPVTLVADLANAAWIRGSWTDDGRIVFETWNAGLRIVSADGGKVRVLTEPKEEWNLGPEVIPGAETVLFFTQSAKGFRIEAIGLDGKDRRTVLEDASQPRYLASGHLLFQRDGGLFIVPFDAKDAKVTGRAMPLPLETMVDDERAATPTPQLAISSNGTLVYAPRQPSARAPSELVWVDRQGKREPLATVPYPAPTFDFSPDGTEMMLAVRDGNRARLARFDLTRQTLTPLHDEQLDIPTAAVFSANGSEIYYARYGTHRGEVLAQKLEGGEPRLLGRFEGTWIAPYSVSRDGRWLVGTLYDPKSQSDIWSLDLEAKDPEDAAHVFSVPGDQEGPALSPDGRWLAYAAYDTGEGEIYAQHFPDGEMKVRVSSGGGQMARWSPDGRELFYLDKDCDAVMAVTVETSPKLELGTPRKLFEGSFGTDTNTGPSFEVSNDGKKFALLLRHENPKQALELIVVQNWFSEVSKMFQADSR